MLAWYREEHLERLYAVEGMTRGRVYQLETAATGGATAEAEIQETRTGARRIIAIYEVEDPAIPQSRTPGRKPPTARREAPPCGRISRTRCGRRGGWIS